MQSFSLCEQQIFVRPLKLFIYKIQGEVQRYVHNMNGISKSCTILLKKVESIAVGKRHMVA